MDSDDVMLVFGAWLFAVLTGYAAYFTPASTGLVITLGLFGIAWVKLVSVIWRVIDAPWGAVVIEFLEGGPHIDLNMHALFEAVRATR